MRSLLVVLTFIQLTGPSGEPVWIIPSQVVSVSGPTGNCGSSSIFRYVANSYVETERRGYCVQETVNQVIDRLTKERE